MRIFNRILLISVILLTIAGCEKRDNTHRNSVVNNWCLKSVVGSNLNNEWYLVANIDSIKCIDGIPVGYVNTVAVNINNYLRNIYVYNSSFEDYTEGSVWSFTDTDINISRKASVFGKISCSGTVPIYIIPKNVEHEFDYKWDACDRDMVITDGDDVHNFYIVQVSENKLYIEDKDNKVLLFFDKL
ncbi:MAG: hypothetical protein N4A72_03255 [Bacteroidales bacterium]|jgi:hypothetical protein|nr:hypothetical protein [Bacteroidales bacterium]